MTRLRDLDEDVCSEHLPRFVCLLRIKSPDSVSPFFAVDFALIAVRGRNADAHSLDPWRNIVYTVRCVGRAEERERVVQKRY